MERIIKVFCVVLLFFGITLPAFSEEFITPTATVVPEPPHTEFAECIKTFPISFDKLYFLTLAGLNEYNYEIKEIQTKSGYIIFETGYRKFLASIVYVSAQKSMLKITPYSGNYDFNSVIPKNLFKYIEANQEKSF